MRRGQARRIGVAIAAATWLHVMGGWVAREWSVAVGVSGDEVREAAEIEAEEAAATVIEVTGVVELAADEIDGIPEIPVSALEGPADETGKARTHPAPSAAVTIAGERAASRGGEAAEAGETAFTGRTDRVSDVPVRRELWNDGREYRSPHERTAKKAGSPEAIRRERTSGVGDRARRERSERSEAGGGVRNERASEGEQNGAAGRASAGQGRGDAVRAPTSEREAPSGARVAQAKEGKARASESELMVDVGEPAVDRQLRAERAADDASAAAASSERRPGPYEITPPAAEGRARAGVSGGVAAPGQLASGTARGTAATTSGAEWGRQDPYLRTMLDRLARAVVFPRQLAIELRTGRPIAEVVLSADGTVGRAVIAVPSAFAAFDRELVRAIEGIGRLPPPPASLLDGRKQIRVRVEWVFDPGLLR